ncbi:hypothetical protein [Cohnella abietis]|uniref:Uncharacterized protein n=1 Tax=Cohnella abietis TaxID=2507935 RepID=A0A3T1D1S4_9BACL|nr:hypothetical protein [Cohnella abietis]BBI32050.1 hypothetical protein KCTCHS21_14490 [Cohnella abietis]
MFKTSKEFEVAMFKILVNIRDGRIYQKDFDFQIDEQECEDALSKALDLGYVTGISFIHGLSGYRSYDARLTYEGLLFVENFKLS